MKKDIGIYTALFVSLILFYGIPFAIRKIRAAWNQSRWDRQTRNEMAKRESAEEYEHQKTLRRERERLEMQAEMRIKELIATLEVQNVADSRKMKQLAAMKAEFANRQNTDMASLLGRLEAMKAAQ